MLNIFYQTKKFNQLCWKTFKSFSLFNSHEIWKRLGWKSPLLPLSEVRLRTEINWVWTSRRNGIKLNASNKPNIFLLILDKFFWFYCYEIRHNNKFWTSKIETGISFGIACFTFWQDVRTSQIPTLYLFAAQERNFCSKTLTADIQISI